jgi:hypothetical protein
LTAVPDGEWFCPDCEDDPGAPVGIFASKKGKKKVKAQAEDAISQSKAAGKRKAPAKTNAGGGLGVSLPRVDILMDYYCSIKA